MPSQNFAVLDLGSQKATLAYFVGGKSLKLKSIASSRIEFGQLVGPNKINTLKQILAGLASQIGLSKGTKIHFSVPSQSVFVRFAKVTAISGSNLKQLAGYELQQQLPVPVEQVAWDYHQIPSNSGEQEVALIAARKQEIDDLHFVLSALGYKSEEASIASIAALNAFYAIQGAGSGTSLLIDIREKTTNLVYTAGNSFYIRSINFGLGSLGAEVSKALGVSEAEAEQRIDASFVAMENVDVAGADPAQLSVATTIKNGIDRLIPQIIQTTSYFQSHFQGQQPNAVFLSGELSNVSHLKEYLQSRMNVTVQDFQPAVSKKASASLDPVLHGAGGQKLTTIYGLAAAEAGTATVNAKLLPSQVAANNDFSKEKPVYFLASALILVAGLLFIGAAFLKKSDLDTKIEDFQATYSDLSYYHEEIQQLESEQSKIEKASEALTEVYSRRELMVRLIAQTAELFKSDQIWISDFGLVANHSFVEGEPAGLDVIDDDLKDIQGVRSFVKVKNEETTNTRSRRNRTEYTINAVKIKGFWLDNPKSQNIVIDLLGEIEAECQDLKVSITGKRKKEDIPLENSQMISYLENPTVNPDQHSWAFELIIPLKTELPL